MQGEERWALVVGYEGLYSVSDRLRVRSEARTVLRGRFAHRVRERILKPSVQARTGLLQVGLADHGVLRRHYVHVLAREAGFGAEQGAQ